jgi:hypothetical protein
LTLKQFKRHEIVSVSIVHTPEQSQQTVAAALVGAPSTTMDATARGRR